MIPHNRPSIGEAEEKAATRVLASGWVAQGKEVAAFEDEICEFLELPHGHAVAVSSGTAALFLAMHVLEAHGRRVALPVYACNALPNAVSMVGANPVFLDCDNVGPNVQTPSEGEADILIAPWMYGMPYDPSALSASLKLIEDGAQALGAKINNKPLGHMGDVAILSFYATKLITSGGQGGMLVSRNSDIIEAAKDFREFDNKLDKTPRFNIQMTDLQAAIGREQLRRLPGFILRREELFQRYLQLPLDWLLETSEQQQAVRYRAIFHASNPIFTINHLRKKGINAIQPLEIRELLVQDAKKFPNANALAFNAVSVPIYPTMSDADCEAVCMALKDCI